MRKLLTASAAALALAGMTIGAAAPAEARYHGGGYHGGYHGGYYGHRGGGRTGAILGAGILGLAAGAVIADGHRGYYDRGGYAYAPAPVYYEAPAYYAPPPYAYYERPQVCRSDWRWDGYARRYVRVQYCD